MRVASEARWWMVESGGRYLLMSALWDPKQLPAPHTGSCSQRSTSFYQENYSKFSRGTNPATALGFLWCTSWWQRDSQLVAEHEDMSWWLPAGRTMNFVTAQLLLVFVRISQKATNLAWLALHVKTKHQGSPFWLCFPGISSFLNGSPGQAELGRLGKSRGVQGWDLPTCTDSTYGLFFMTVLAPGGHHPCCFLIPRSSPPQEKRRGGRKERSWLEVFCRVSDVALNYVLTGRCQVWLCQRGGAIVGHHHGGRVFGKRNLLLLHSGRRGNLALFCACTGPTFI